MYNIRNIHSDLVWVGASDHRLSLFENIHPIPRGVSYNAYVLLDEKNALLDTADWSVCPQFLENLKAALDGKELDYIVVHHVEPDHLASLGEVMLRYPEAQIVASAKAISMMEQFGFAVKEKAVPVKEGDTLELGKHTLTFAAAPMVHWPEVLVSYDAVSKTLFSADAFGTFGALDGILFNDETDFDRDWIDDARRYYTNIVGKYGIQTTNLLKKASALDIETICPLHGPVWRNNLGYFIEKHQKWAAYIPEVQGVLLAYASIYGHTESVVQALASKLVQAGIPVAVYDVSNTDASVIVSEAFKYSHMVLASPTYNACVFPKMQEVLDHFKMLNLQKRTVALIENGSWAATAAKGMRTVLESMKDMTILDASVKITGSMHDPSALDVLVEEIKKSFE